MKKVILFGLFFLLIAGGIGYYLFNKPAKESADEDPDFTISATELYQAYQKDENQANQKYLNKIIKISGAVKEINTGSDGLPSILLETGDIFGVSCSVSKQSEEEAKKVKPGENIVLQGYCAGGGGMMDVALDKCILLK